MVNLDKDLEAKILKIVGKYHNEPDYELNYLITDDTITLFSSINIGKMITVEDLQIIAKLLDAEFQGITTVNQEYRFAYKLNK